jgi:hypothetical protein
VHASPHSHPPIRQKILMRGNYTSHGQKKRMTAAAMSLDMNMRLGWRSFCSRCHRVARSKRKRRISACPARDQHTPRLWTPRQGGAGTMGTCPHCRRKLRASPAATLYLCAVKRWTSAPYPHAARGAREPFARSSKTALDNAARKQHFTRRCIVARARPAQTTIQHMHTFY